MLWQNQPVVIQPLKPLKNEIEILSEKVDKQVGLKSEEDDEPAANSKEIEDNEVLKYNFLSNIAIDLFKQINTIELLFIQDGLNIYGYETNTGVKIVVGTSAEIEPASFQGKFKQVQRLYLQLVLNPFQKDFTNMKISDKFVSQLSSIFV